MAKKTLWQNRKNYVVQTSINLNIAKMDFWNY